MFKHFPKLKKRDYEDYLTVYKNGNFKIKPSTWTETEGYKRQVSIITTKGEH